MILTTDNVRISFSEFDNVRVRDLQSSHVYIEFTTQRGDVLQLSVHRKVWDALVRSVSMWSDDNE